MPWKNKKRDGRSFMEILWRIIISFRGRMNINRRFWYLIANLIIYIIEVWFWCYWQVYGGFVFRGVVLREWGTRVIKLLVLLKVLRTITGRWGTRIG